MLAGLLQNDCSICLHVCDRLIERSFVNRRWWFPKFCPRPWQWIQIWDYKQIDILHFRLQPAKRPFDLDPLTRRSKILNQSFSHLQSSSMLHDPPRSVISYPSEQTPGESPLSKFGLLPAFGEGPGVGSHSQSPTKHQRDKVDPADKNRPDPSPSTSFSPGQQSAP